MKFRFEKILEAISERDLKDFYCSMYKECNTEDRASYEAHILSYLRFYLRARRYPNINQDKGLELTIKAMKVLSFLEYMEIKYNLKQGE